MTEDIFKLETHYIKTPQHKTNYASGVIGGVTSIGQIHMSFFLERNVLPNRIVYDVDTFTGKISKENIIESKSGNVREIDTSIILDLTTAKALNEWLNIKIAEAENLRK